MTELHDALKKLAESLSSHDHEVLVLADKTGDIDTITSVAEALISATRAIKCVCDKLEEKNDKKSEASKSGLTIEKLDEMVALADSFDESGDEFLIRQASVIDEVLLTIGANKSQVAAMKGASDSEIEKIRANQKSTRLDPYTAAKTEQDKDNHVEEAKKLISDAVKTYRPLEHGLSVRTCLDHPGAQMSRIGDNIYQCSLDKGIFNYNDGFTTMKGNKIPGGSVANQTQSLHDRANEFTSFDTRESRLNSI